MFDWIRKLFSRKDKEEVQPVEETKIEFSTLEPDEDLKNAEMPASRFTQEYAEFVESEISKAPEKSLAEEMMEDPFADVAAQDEDVEVPEVQEEAEETAEEETAAEAEEAEEKTEEELKKEMMDDPFADLSAEYEEVE